MSPDEAQVLAANDAFYEAFAASDFPRMSDLWAQETAVMCIHPGWDVLVGRGDVLDSWRGIFGGGGAPIVASRARALITGEVAMVTCLEGAHDEPPSLIATNTFVREQGRWKMIHHHAGPVARMRELPPLRTAN